MPIKVSDGIKVEAMYKDAYLTHLRTKHSDCEIQAVKLDKITKLKFDDPTSILRVEQLGAWKQLEKVSDLINKQGYKSMAEYLLCVYKKTDEDEYRNRITNFIKNAA